MKIMVYYLCLSQQVPLQVKQRCDTKLLELQATLPGHKILVIPTYDTGGDHIEVLDMTPMPYPGVNYTPFPSTPPYSPYTTGFPFTLYGTTGGSGISGVQGTTIKASSVAPYPGGTISGGDGNIVITTTTKPVDDCGHTGSPITYVDTTSGGMREASPITRIMDPGPGCLDSGMQASMFEDGENILHFPPK